MSASTAAALETPGAFQVRPISDLRTRLNEIEESAQAGAQIVMNRNGKPVLLVQDYQTAMRERELERHRQKIREAEIWDRAVGGVRVSLQDVVAALESDRAEFSSLMSGAQHD